MKHEGPLNERYATRICTIGTIESVIPYLLKCKQLPIGPQCYSPLENFVVAHVPCIHLVPTSAEGPDTVIVHRAQ